MTESHTPSTPARSEPRADVPDSAPRGRNWQPLLTMAIAALVLLAGGVSLRAWVASEGWVLQKKPIYPARELTELPEQLGRGFRYQLTRKEPRLSEDVEKELGTTRYISWIYEDTRKEGDQPGRYIRLHIPYYTGTTDPVPHVSDRCHVAAGAQLVSQDEGITLEPKMPIRERSDGGVVVMTINGSVELPSARVPAVVNEFHDPRRNDTYFVTYFFIANNVFVGDRTGVRMQAFDLVNEHAYYAKVEITPLGVETKAEAVAATEAFLAAALPEMMRIMPEWKAPGEAENKPRIDPLRLSDVSHPNPADANQRVVDTR